ncbi:MAG: hypothetical protein GQ542_08485, partial [Desulforhopalus sp.]|nr:hypothetical protein [Desulforhopalus sp.]
MEIGRRNFLGILGGAAAGTLINPRSQAGASAIETDAPDALGCLVDTTLC